MKKMIAVAIAATALLYACSAKLSPTNNNIAVDKSGKPMLVGTCRQTDLERAPFGEWFNKNYADYKVNDTVTKAIRPLVKNKNFLLFMGTWCGDSKREIPRMLKILKDLGVRKTRVQLVMVDNHDSVYKQSPAHEEKGLNIHRVPTMIVYENGKELGRIVESPIVSLEKDLLAIVRKDPYRPNYRGVAYMDSLFKTKQAVEFNNEETAGVIKPMLENAAELNTYGYVLMARKEMQQALLVFQMNVLLYPQKANVYDSLGEYYFNTGNKAAALENYKKVLEIDPKNEHAKKMIEKLGG